MTSATEKRLVAAVEDRLAKIDAILAMAQRMLDAQQAQTEATAHAIIQLHDRVTRLEAWMTKDPPHA